MVRIFIVIALLASLVYTVRHWQPAPEATVAKTPANRSETTTAEPPAETASGGFYPAVPEALPDVEKGYIFSEKRKIEKEPPPGEVKPAVAEPGPEVLDSVAYTGSLILGETRRALVTFQEPSQEGPTPHRPTPPKRPGAAPAAPAQGTPQNKQLVPGDRLLGFVVKQIDPDRIVFEKGTLKVEKFLYDRNKQRLIAEAVRSEPKPAAAAPAPAAQAIPPETPVDTAAIMAANAEQAAAMQANRMSRRSQRLLGADTKSMVPPMPVMPVPGRPVPKKQPSQ